MKIVCIVGTRPEAIKMAPVILALRQVQGVEVRVLATAQHRQMLDQVLDCFGIAPDIDLDVMRPGQTLSTLLARLLERLDAILREEQPDVVLVQGDTTTVLAASLASFHLGIAIGHVEAGLRTGDMRNPFPEEANRVITSRLARWHFAPTEEARQNLLHDGVPDAHILVTGNTVIDALLQVAGQQREIGVPLDAGKRLVLVTAHRRESFGDPLRHICGAIRRLAGANPDVEFLYPVHPNPQVRAVVNDMLDGVSGIRLCDPLGYPQFVAAMERAHFIISDSGGVQEEAPALGRPVLLLRNETERPEAVRVGAVRLVGADEQRIVREAQRLLDDDAAWRDMVPGVSPYGDGQAARRIAARLLERE